MTRSEKPSRDELIDPSLICVEVTRRGGRMDRRVGFIVLPSISRSLEFSIYKSRSKVAPLAIERLFLDQCLKIKGFVVLVRLGSRVTEETFLIQLLC